MILLSLLSVAAMVKTWFLLLDYCDWSRARFAITLEEAMLDSFCWRGACMWSLVRFRFRYSFKSAFINYYN